MKLLTTLSMAAAATLVMLTPAAADYGKRYNSHSHGYHDQSHGWKYKKRNAHRHHYHHHHRHHWRSRFSNWRYGYRPHRNW